jgi:alkylation response protein AidB-like acyl-CoA dehydrogenase
VELDFTDEQEALRDSIRAVLTAECPPSLVRAIAEGEATADDLWTRLVGLDWPALTVPEAAGGVGYGYVELAVLAEELGRSLAPGPLLPTISQFVPTVVELAGADHPAAARVARGAAGTLALAEAPGRWTAETVTTEIAPSGAGWVVTGEKRWVFEPAMADEVVVVGRLPGTSGTDGITAVVVPTDAARVELLEAFDRTRALGTLRLDGVTVDEDGLVGEPGTVGPPVARVVEQATVALALETLGACQVIFETALAYAGEREQFGVPIGSFQAVKHKLADLHVALERARATAYWAAATIAEDDEQRTMATAMAKAAVGEAQQVVAQDGIQLLGGIGYTWEHDQHLWVKRAKSGDALFGTAADHRARVADLLDL